MCPCEPPTAYVIVMWVWMFFQHYTSQSAAAGSTPTRSKRWRSYELVRSSHGQILPTMTPAFWAEV